jgi:formylglycine-generating enzyme required for sulfatase activity
MLCKAIVRGLLAVVVFLVTDAVIADTFGTDANQFTINFVPIFGATNPTSGYGIVNHDYRMGTYEITADQWNKFMVNLGVPVTGNPSHAYDSSTSDTDVKLPANHISWYEAAQFVNWLNTSTGHQAAYKFTGTQGSGDYALATWSTADAANGTNLFRNKDAFYFLPTEDEWVKAAYWNGTTLQSYATKAGESLKQGNGTNGTGWNYYDNGYATNPAGKWEVGSGSQELNGTYDMMGNAGEWMENPYSDTSYGLTTQRAMRGSSYGSYGYMAASSYRIPNYPTADEFDDVGFRVASVPEPGSLVMLAGVALAALLCWWRKRA